MQQTHVALLNELMRTRQSVTSSVILAAMMSTGMMKETQDMMTKMPVGRYTFSRYGVTKRLSRISNEYME